MAEYGGFMRERQNLDRQISKTSDPQMRQGLELRKRIEAAEYMEITSKRIAGQSETITGQRNSPEAIRQRERAEGFHEEAQSLRKGYRELYTSRADDGSRDKSGQEQGRTLKTAPQSDIEKFNSRASAPKSNTAMQGREMPSSTPKTVLMVEDRVLGKKDWPQYKLSDYVSKIPQKSPPREFTAEQIRNDPNAKRERTAQRLAEQGRGRALDHIARDIKANRKLNGKDIRRLSGADLKNIKTQGDDYLKNLAQQHERQRGREKGRDR